MSYAETIREARMSAGLTPAALARRLSVSLSRVQSWESGEALPSILQLPMLCAALSISYEDFFSLPPVRGRKHRRKQRRDAWQVSLLPVMCNHTIRFYRLKRRLTVEALAQACGATAQQAEKWEAGTAIPRLEQIPLLCGALKIRLWEFFE